MSSKLRRQLQEAEREMERLVRAEENPIVRAGLAELRERLREMWRGARSDPRPRRD